MEDGLSWQQQPLPIQRAPVQLTHQYTTQKCVQGWGRNCLPCFVQYQEQWGVVSASGKGPDRSNNVGQRLGSGLHPRRLNGPQKGWNIIPKWHCPICICGYTCIETQYDWNRCVRPKRLRLVAPLLWVLGGAVAKCHMTSTGVGIPGIINFCSNRQRAVHSNGYWVTIDDRSGISRVQFFSSDPRIAGVGRVLTVYIPVGQANQRGEG